MAATSREMERCAMPCVCVYLVRVPHVEAVLGEEFLLSCDVCVCV